MAGASVPRCLPKMKKPVVAIANTDTRPIISEVRALRTGQPRKLHANRMRGSASGMVALVRASCTGYIISAAPLKEYIRRLPAIRPMKYRIRMAPIRAAALFLRHNHITPAGTVR